MHINSGRARNCHIDKYIGSDFDKVITVADSIDAVKTDAASIADINTVAAVVADIGTVADNINKNLVKERFTITQGDQVFNFTNLLSANITCFITGQLIDRGTIGEGKDYDVTGDRQITLKRTYPTGTVLEVSQSINADTSTLVSQNEYQDLLNRVKALENK